jgi:hypothetical protein
MKVTMMEYKCERYDTSIVKTYFMRATKKGEDFRIGAWIDLPLKRLHILNIEVLLLALPTDIASRNAASGLCISAPSSEFSEAVM